jgi:uncharacterized LabA/DUF88 family protein
MPNAREAIEKLADDPDARVMVFVDGQNLYKACARLFGHPLCHPHLLAECLAGTRTARRVSCRFYTGRPDPHRPAEKTKARNLDRRLNGISRHGGTVQTRTLRYHWDWSHREELPEPGLGVAHQTVTLHPWERPHEKGIDVLIALDVIEMILADRCDVAVVVSLDRDLREIPAALRNLETLIDRPYRLEAAVPVATDEGFPKQLSGFNFTHQIGPTLFDVIRDDTDYTVSDAVWTAPTFHADLAAAQAAAEVRAASTAGP